MVNQVAVVWYKMQIQWWYAADFFFLICLCKPLHAPPLYWLQMSYKADWSECRATNQATQMLEHGEFLTTMLQIISKLSVRLRSGKTPPLIHLFGWCRLCLQKHDVQLCMLRLWAFLHASVFQALPQAHSWYVVCDHHRKAHALLQGVCAQMHPDFSTCTECHLFVVNVSVWSYVVYFTFFHSSV